MENKKIIAIDGNSLINRAFYALPPLNTKDGIHTNAVYGFINMLNKLFSEYEPEYAAVAFDLKAPTFRHKEYTEYKAGRKKTPFELLQQFPLLKKVLKAMGITILEMEGFEADDLIGTVARMAEEEKVEAFIVTGDRDALQLASENTKIIFTKKGISEFDLYDEKAMLERYHMSSKQFIDLKGLMGDSSDNIPGVPGVGEKTGIALIEQFGSIANMLEHTDRISKPKLREKIENNAAQALMSRRLAEIQTNVPIDVDFEDFKIANPDKEKLIEIYRELELFSLITKLDKSWIFKLNADKSASDVQKSGESTELFIEANIEEFKAAIKGENAAYIKLLGDSNHVNEPQIYGALIEVKNKAFYYKTKENIQKAFELMADEGISFKGHFLKNDYFMLKSILPREYAFKTKSDTAIAQYVLEPQRNDFGYKALSMIYLNEEMDDEQVFYKNNAQGDLFGLNDEKYARYAMKCIRMSRLLEPILEKQIDDYGMNEVYHDIELPLIEIFADMEYEGFCVDRSELLKTAEVITKDLSGIEERIYELAGERFNIKSPKQLGIILFEKLQIPGGKKTKTGYSTNVDVLEKLTGEYEIAGLVLKYRTLTKLMSTYVEGLLPLISPKDGKIRAHFQQTGTATGRISCTEPNLQNIPVKQELGRTLRRAFVAEKDCVLVDADYSQIELRVLAHISGDEGLIDAFNHGADIHRSTASKVFEIPEDEVTPLQRSSAKAVNFGVIYGMSGFGLSENLHITRREAEKYIKDYFVKYASVKTYMNETVENCKKNGYVTTLKGRRRYIPEVNASNYMQRQAGERLAMNSPIQGSAADIIKLAMIKVFDELKEKGYKSKLILQVHDELIINTHKDEEEAVKELLKRNMMQAFELKVPLDVGMDSGQSWYEVK